MGVTQSNNYIDFNKKLYIVIDLYLKPKYEQTRFFDIDKLKNDNILKKNIRDIIVNSLLKKYNYNVILLENNILFVLKTDINNIKYLEMNTSLEFDEIIEEKVKPDIIPTSTPTFIYPNQIIVNNSNNITKETIKLNILSNLYEYVSNKLSINTADITLIILYQTLYNIEIYQK